jgi:hypothetical protein
MLIERSIHSWHRLSFNRVIIGFASMSKAEDNRLTTGYLWEVPGEKLAECRPRATINEEPTTSGGQLPKAVCAFAGSNGFYFKPTVAWRGVSFFPRYLSLDSSSSTARTCSTTSWVTLSEPPIPAGRKPR